MDNLIYLGKLGHRELLEKEFGGIMSDDVIVTAERLAHISENHPQDCALFEKNISVLLNDPDFIIKDSFNRGTVFVVKELAETNLNMVVRLVLETDDSSLKNSVITFYRLRSSNFKKLINKHKTLYKKE